MLSLFAATVAVALTTQVHAASITVNTTNDELNTDGDCSLREAIQSFSTQSAVDGCVAGAGNDTITLPAGTYTLAIPGSGEDGNATGDLDVGVASVVPVNPITLTIQGAGATTTVIDGGGLDRVLHLRYSTSTLILQDLTIRNGALTDVGGAGILSWGNLVLRRVIVENNTITFTGSGDAAIGGGICLGCVTGTGSGVLEQVILQNNSAARGGGLFSNQPLTITASSLISNTAVSGGGITNYGALTLVNSTVSANVATFIAGGIDNDVPGGNLSLLNSTISHNQRVGIRFWSGATASLKNTIVAYNTDGGWFNCDGTAYTSAGYNLSSDGSCTNFTAPGDLNNTDPLLGLLQNNGGFTPTRALLSGSPAINAGTNTDCPATDQRGVARPQGGVCDIGAFEREWYALYLPLVRR
jgi:CSLREA domain-containing protein